MADFHGTAKHAQNDKFGFVRSYLDNAARFHNIDRKYIQYPDDVNVVERSENKFSLALRVSGAYGGNHVFSINFSCDQTPQIREVNGWAKLSCGCVLNWTSAASMNAELDKTYCRN